MGGSDLPLGTPHPPHLADGDVHLLDQMLVWSIVRHFTGETIVGWTSLVVSLWFLGGLILLSIGVIGEYVAKIYLEVKRRPRYLVQDFIDGNAVEKK